MLVANPLRERMRPRNADLSFPLGIGKQEAEVVYQTDSGHGDLPDYLTVVKIVIKFLGRPIYLHARKSLDEVVDHIVAAKLAIRHNIESCDFLVLDGRFHRRVVDLVEFHAANPSSEIFRFQPFQPARHRVAADHRGGKNGKSHGPYSRLVVYRIEVFEPGRYV